MESYWPGVGTRPLLNQGSSVIPCPSQSSSSLTKNDPREPGAGSDPRVISIRSLQSGIISQGGGDPSVFEALSTAALSLDRVPWLKDRYTPRK